MVDDLSKEAPLHLLVKFGKQININSLHESGEVFFGPIEYYQKAEQGSRGDKYEGTTHIYQPSEITLEVNDEKITGLAGPVRIRDGEEDWTHLYCLSCVCADDEVREDGKIFSDRVKEFGDSLCVIMDTQSFFNSIERQIIKSEFVTNCNKPSRVSYVDILGVNGKYGILSKPNEFSWQKELRIVLSAPKRRGEPISFKIGSLNESYVQDMDKFTNRYDAKNGIYLFF